MNTPEVVDVIVDGFTHLGPLAYFADAELQAQVGDAVSVPFGNNRTLNGVIVGQGDPSKAVKHVQTVHGPRTTPGALQAAREVAYQHASYLQSITPRLAPTHKKGRKPINTGHLQLNTTIPLTTDHHSITTGLLLLHPPLLPGEYLAAVEATRLATHGQVLIICPTNASVDKTLSYFNGGAARLDGKSTAGAWDSFMLNQTPIAIGTRAAAWYSTPNLKAIILVDEHSEAHREIRQPRTHSREVILKRAQYEPIQPILLSAAPTPAATAPGITPHTVSYTDPALNWPKTILHERKHDIIRSNDLPYVIYNEVKEAVQNMQTVLFKVSGNARHICTSCGKQHPTADTTCTSCDNPIRTLGYDKERIHELLGSKVDVETYWEENDTTYDHIYLPEVDGLLTKPELIPYKTAGQVITEAAARATTASSVLTLILDSADHPLIGLLVKDKDQWGVASRAYNTAKRLNLPPFGKLLTLQFKRKTPPKLENFPGVAHGPYPVDGGWEYLIRYTSVEEPLILGKLKEYKQKNKSVKYYTS